ncbi:MAG: phospholipase D-like domain-containing protein [Acidiferrobacterales bacterium]
MIASWTLSHLALTAGFMFAAVLITQVIRQRRPPTATIAWLLAIVLVPYVGVPLYLFLGGRKLHNLAARKSHIKLPTVEVQMALSPMERLLLAHDVPPATRNNRFLLHQTGQDSYSALVDLIEAATRSIYISIFILHPDSVGQDIVARLARRAAEGLTVRLLLDGVGSMHTHRRSLAPLVEAGGRFAFFMPVLHRPFRGRSNLRNHRKIVISDERRVLAGGANIAAQYMGSGPGSGRWPDLTFTLEGPAVIYYANLFRCDWGFASGEWMMIEPQAVPSAGSCGEATVQVVPSGPDVPGDPLYDVLLTVAFSAQRRLWIVTPYFVPDDALCRALILAVHRGVDVQILVPERSNHRIADIAGRSYLREIADEGGKVIFYKGGMLHAKAVLMDQDLAILGSANIDLRSLLLNYEVGMLIYSAAHIQTVGDWVTGLADGSRVGVDAAGRLRELVEGIARLLAPQL